MTLKWKHENKTEHKRKEIEQFDWFVERIQTGMALRKRSGEIKTFMPKNFPEINWYFALTSYILQHNWPIVDIVDWSSFELKIKC